MCTLSWVPQDGGYTLAFNRDERRTRVAGVPPSRTIRNGVPVLLPHDPDGGGSWISLNATGHTLALLNRYEDTPHDSAGEYQSRGELVSAMAGLAGSAEVAAGLEAVTLGSYRPFTLASVAREQAPKLFEWNGSELLVAQVSNAGLVRASSGSDQAAAESARGAVFLELGDRLTGADLLALHRRHLPEASALSR